MEEVAESITGPENQTAQSWQWKNTRQRGRMESEKPVDLWLQIVNPLSDLGFSQRRWSCCPLSLSAQKPLAL